jgi:hypothetical protein
MPSIVYSYPGSCSSAVHLPTPRMAAWLQAASLDSTAMEEPGASSDTAHGATGSGAACGDTTTCVVCARFCGTQRTPYCAVCEHHGHPQCFIACTRNPSLRVAGCFSRIGLPVPGCDFVFCEHCEWKHRRHCICDEQRSAPRDYYWKTIRDLHKAMDISDEPMRRRLKQQIYNMRMARLKSMARY